VKQIYFKVFSRTPDNTGLQSPQPSDFVPVIGRIPDVNPFYEVPRLHYVRKSHKRQLVRLGVVLVENRRRIQQQVKFRRDFSVEL
jgi:hypothetical protein